MRKPFDPYNWSKTRITTLVDKIQSIKNDGLDVSYGEVWSIKKHLLLDYYVGAFVRIISSKRFNFKKWYYVDTHCGSGVIGFKEKTLSNERFPGSPLIVALRGSEFPFHEYVFSDIEQTSVDTLKRRLKALEPTIGKLNYSFNIIDFAKTVALVETKNQHGNAFLIFVDPTGFTEINWSLMERLLKIGTADIIFTFMTYGIAFNRSKAEGDPVTAQSFNEFFGNDNWKNYSDGGELAELYRKQMAKFKTHTALIPVYQTGERLLYHMIIATNSRGGANVFDSAKKVMDETTTELFRDALKVVTGKTKDLTDYF